MSSLFAALHASGNALEVLQRALDVTQNNVNNASTPGYARQRLSLEAAPFQPAEGLSGGVQAGDVQSARDQYADQEVRRQLAAMGYFDQKASSLGSVESVFDISGDTGISSALDKLFQAFSAWSAAPNSMSARQAVVSSAETVVQAFQRAAASLSRASSNADLQLQATVAEINGLAARLREYNVERLRTGQADGNLEANMTSTLEQLSKLVDIDATRQADGTVTVLLGGQTPLVIGAEQYGIAIDTSGPNDPSALYPNAPPAARVVSADGTDITTQISQGKLAGLLEFRNTFLPSLIGDANQAGGLNRLAKAMADRVNQLLTSGLASDGPPAQQGVALFTYSGTGDTTVAMTLSVNPSLTLAQLAAIDPGPPYSSNGTALKLAQLASPTGASDKIDGLGYGQFYAQLASTLGSELAGATDSQDVQGQVLAQAQSLRDKASGVSLDEEAVQLIEFQRAYQANARMVTVLNELTQTTLNMLGP